MELGLLYYNARYYLPGVGRFISPDTIIPNPADPQSWNRFSYTNNNPLRYTDPTGHWLESAWDAFNVGLGIASFVDNLSQGNYGWAAVDAVGVVVDAAALITPIVPGGVGSLIKGVRGVDAVVDVVQAVNRVENVADAAQSVSRLSEVAEATGDMASFYAAKYTDGSVLYATGNTSGPRLPRIQDYNVNPGQKVDINVDSTGNIIPNTGGASTFQSIEQLPTRGHVWQLDTSSGTPGFNIKPDGIPFGTQPPGHVSLVPNKPMTPQECISCFQNLNWNPVMTNGRHLKIQ
jgi:RHS repeat-associated protein